jgi:hypothetical protein
VGKLGKKSRSSQPLCLEARAHVDRGRFGRTAGAIANDFRAECERIQDVGHACWSRGAPSNRTAGKRTSGKTKHGLKPRAARLLSSFTRSFERIGLQEVDEKLHRLFLQI